MQCTLENINGGKLLLLPIPTYRLKKVPMGGLPWETAKDGNGCSFSVSAYNHKGVPMSCLQ